MVVIYNEKLYAPEEVAKILGTSRATVYNYVEAGLLDPTPLKSVTYISEKALVRYLTGLQAKQLRKEQTKE